jgi:hypothetical protein
MVGGRGLHPHCHGSDRHLREADGQVLSDSAIAAVSDQRAHIKNVPGRNTDVNDVTWLAHLMAHGLTRRGLRDRP